MALKDIRQGQYDEAKERMMRFSRSTLANVLGVSRPTYVDMEENPERITYEQASKLAAYLGCDIGDIFCAA